MVPATCASCVLQCASARKAAAAMSLLHAILNSQSRGDQHATRDILSSCCWEARPAWDLPRGPYYKGEPGEAKSAEAEHRQGGDKVASGATGQTQRTR
jgi:hypothetical protein